MRPQPIPWYRRRKRERFRLRESHASPLRLSENTDDAPRDLGNSGPDRLEGRIAPVHSERVSEHFR